MAKSYRRTMGGRRRRRRTAKKGGNTALKSLALPMSLYAASFLPDRRSLRDYQRSKKRHHSKKDKKGKKHSRK